jgi:hypothetical protein
MIRCLLPLAAVAAVLAGPALAHPPECPALDPSQPIPAAECDAPAWGAWDGGKVVSRGLTLSGVSPECTIPQMSPGWAMLQIVQAPYPPSVIQALYAVTETQAVTYVDPESGTGCEVRGYAVGWRSEADIGAAVETYGRRAQAACAAEIVAGTIGPGRTDYADICAYAAGVRERIARGEIITNPGEYDPARWCGDWQGDCAAPAVEEVKRLIGVALAARARAADCDPAETDPEAEDYCLPAPDLCGGGWTHSPCTGAAPVEP